MEITNKQIEDLKMALECGMYCSSCWFKTLKMMDEHNDYAKRLLKWVHGGYSNNDQALKRIQKALQKAEDVIRNEERGKLMKEMSENANKKGQKRVTNDADNVFQ